MKGRLQQFDYLAQLNNYRELVAAPENMNQFIKDIYNCFRLVDMFNIDVLMIKDMLNWLLGTYQVNPIQIPIEYVYTLGILVTEKFMKKHDYDT